MSDDLDQLLRAAMKHLDGEAPSEYFERLPNRTLERLETSMQTDTSSHSADPAAPPPTEDSGLHDIRSLAQSARMRLSSKRVTGSPIDEDGDLAASSAGWKAVALPEPAKMVSLPELADLPSAAEIKAKDKAAKKAAKEAEKAAERAAKDADKVVKPIDKPVDKDAIKVATAVEATVTPIAKAPKAAPARKPTTAKASNLGRNIAIAGLGLAAAAGITFVVISGNNAPTTADNAAAPAVATTDVKPTVTPAPPPPPAAPVVVQPPAPVDDKPADIIAVVAPPKSEPLKPSGKAMTKKSGDHVVTIEDSKTKKPEPPPQKKIETAKDPNAKPGDPSFDALLKEAGVDDKKTDDKPKLAKKALSASDITNGMAGAAGKAQACFKGTQGTASVRLTVAPSGQVTKMIVSGVFAGKPEATCLESSLRGISFPPWDGGPQSFGYSYLLSE